MGGGGRLNVDFKSRLKLDLFFKSYIYSERGNFAASFYNKNSILMFFPKQSIWGGGVKQYRCKHSIGFAIIFNIYKIKDENSFYSIGKTKVSAVPKTFARRIAMINCKD